MVETRGTRSASKAQKPAAAASSSRNRSRSASRCGKKSGKAPGSTRGQAKTSLPLLEKLCIDAIKAELVPGVTSDSLFFFLAAIQFPVLMLLSAYLGDVFRDVALICMGGHWVGWAYAEVTRSNKWFDVHEDITYLLCFSYVYRRISSPTPSQQAIFYAAFVWGFRLLGFLGTRIVTRGSDWRFDALIKHRAYNFFGWTTGGTWCYLNGFCIWVVADHTEHTGPLTSLTVAGLALSGAGLIAETTADYQKYHFPHRGKKWIESGLWSLSRHPNYLGEIACWLGLGIASVGALHSPADSPALVALAAVSPIWSLLFLFFTSLMLLEKKGNNLWGKGSKASAATQAEYEAFKERVPILFPVHV